MNLLVLVLVCMLQASLVSSATFVSHARPRKGIRSNRVQTLRSETANDVAWELIDKAVAVGQIGAKASEEDQTEIASLSAKLASYSRGNGDYARLELSGVHELVYSTSPGGSSGAIGPFVGKVTQTFVDDEKFINSVELGPVRIELNAVRSVLDGLRIRVKFEETIIKLFGLEVSRSPSKGQGLWKTLYAGEVQRNGDRRLLRVMETPSLFIIQKRI